MGILLDDTVTPLKTKALVSWHLHKTIKDDNRRHSGGRGANLFDHNFHSKDFTQSGYRELQTSVYTAYELLDILNDNQRIEN
jgi:hypothetical protein